MGSLKCHKFAFNSKDAALKQGTQKYLWKNIGRSELGKLVSVTLIGERGHPFSAQLESCLLFPHIVGHIRVGETCPGNRKQIILDIQGISSLLLAALDFLGPVLDRRKGFSLSSPVSSLKQCHS